MSFLVEREETLFLQADGGEQRVFLISAYFQLPSAQNNPYDKVAYLGMAYSATPQLTKQTFPPNLKQLTNLVKQTGKQVHSQLKVSFLHEDV